MGYIVNYDHDGSARYRKTFHFQRKGLRTGLIIVVILLACITFNGMSDILVPGNANVTKAAVSTFCEDVKAGASFGEAFRDFCTLIINNEI